MSEKYINSSQVLLLSHFVIYIHSHDSCISFYGTLKDVILNTHIFLDVKRRRRFDGA
jgi:hypothetical protein